MSTLEEPTTTEDEQAPSPQATKRPGLLRRAGATSLLAGTLVILLVAGLVVSLVELSDQHASNTNANNLRSSALAAAGRYGVYISSYDYRDLNGPTAAWTEVDRNSTPTFAKKFDSTKANIATLINDYHGSATGTVVAAGLANVDSKRAVALLFIDQQLSNSTQKNGPQVEPLRVEMVLARQHGKWLIDDIEVPK